MTTPSAVDRLLEAALGATGPERDPTMTAAPRLRLAVVTCMDARIDPVRLLGLGDGDAHVVRNAGGLVTDDAIRSLMLSQRLLGTEEVVVIQHTECGLHELDEAGLMEAVQRDTGVAPDFALGGFDDLDQNLHASLERLRTSPLLPHRDRVRGFIYHVREGVLREPAEVSEPGSR